MGQNSFKNDLTEGNVAKGLLAFAIPLFASNMLQVVYNIVDMVVVGQEMGKVGMSGVAIGGEIFHFLTALAMGYCNAGQVIIAQNIGAKRNTDVNRIIGTLFSAITIFAIFLTCLCFIFRSSILELLATPAESYDEAMAYTVTCIFGLIFVYGYNIVSAILRGMGDSKRPFTFIVIATVVNVVLDLLFVIVFKWRAFGAALATVIGQAVSFIFSLIYLYRRKEAFGFDFKPESFKISVPHLKVLMSLGIPMCIQYAAINFSRIMVSRWVNSFGVTTSAVSGVYNKLTQMTSQFSNAIFTSGGAMVGQNIGAQKYDRVNKVLLISICFMLCVNSVLALSVNLFPNTIFSMFTQDADVISTAAVLVLPITIFMLTGILRTPSLCLINGSGNSKLNLIIALLDGFAVRLGLAYLFTFKLGMEAYGCWLADGLTGCVPFLVGGTYYLTGKWKTNKYLLKKTSV